MTVVDYVKLEIFRSDMGNTGRAVKTRVIDLVRHFMVLQQFIGEWLVERSELFGIVHVLVQPDGVVFGVE